MFNIALGIFLFLSPILFLPLSVPAIATLQWYQFGFFTNGIEVVQRQIFMYGIVLLMISALFDVPKRLFGDNMMKWLLLICFCVVYAYPITIKIFPTVFLGFLLYYLVSVCADVRNLKPFFIIIILVSAINSIFSILQIFHIHFLMFKNDEIIGLMGYKTQLGIYQALALPICYIFNPWLCIIPAIGLILSNSATAILSAIIGMFYLLHKKGLRIQSIPIWQVFFMLTLIYLYSHFDRLPIRFESWKYAIQGGIYHWFKGNGICLFNYTKPMDGNNIKLFTDPYNLYLEVFWSLGIFGLLAFLFFLHERFYKFKADNDMKIALFTSCLIFVIVGFGYSFMDYPRLAGTAIVLFGLLTAVKKDGAKCL